MTLIYSLWKYFTPSKTPYILNFESTTSHFFREIDTEWHVTAEVLLHSEQNQIHKKKNSGSYFPDFFCFEYLHFYSKNIRIKNFLLYGFDFVHSEAILLQLCAIQYQFHENRLEVVDPNFKVNLVAFGTNSVHCALMKLLYDNKAKQAAIQLAAASV